MTQDITHITIVSDRKAIKDYQRGDMGQPTLALDSAWYLCCPWCGNTIYVHAKKIEKHEDGTVSSKVPLHCHGSNMTEQYSIEHNEIRRL
jgi:hypothetical protein